MTKKDFFILIIKIFGLYYIITVLFTNFPLLVAIPVEAVGFASIIHFILTIVVIIGLFAFLIFKSQYLVKLLKLEKGFDNDNLELGNLTNIEIVKIATLIIGGLLIIHNLSAFINQTISAFYSNIHLQAIAPNYKWHWFVTGLNILIGYLMITNLNFIVRLLRVKNKNEK